MAEAETDLSPGTLYIVSTPIGNLKDITLRAIEVLKNVDLIAAEDTRHTRILLERHQIATPTTSYYDFNKEKRLPSLIRRLKEGGKIAVVSDAGTPGISDPAFRLVRACIDSDLEIQAVPGATAFVPALVLSGLPTDSFVFGGFLPAKKGRKSKLAELESEKRTIVLYESVHRVERTLADLLEVLGDRQAAVVREITKKFEEIHRGRLSELCHTISKIKLKGEFVLVVEGKTKRGGRIR